MKQLFEAYVSDLEARGKGPESVGRAAQTATAVEAVLPELLAKPVGRHPGRGHLRVPSRHDPRRETHPGDPCG